jgi:hypothetical protein
VAVHIRQPAINAIVANGELRMIQAEKVQNGRV